MSHSDVPAYSDERGNKARQSSKMLFLERWPLCNRTILPLSSHTIVWVQLPQRDALHNPPLCPPTSKRQKSKGVSEMVCRLEQLQKSTCHFHFAVTWSCINANQPIIFILWLCNHVFILSRCVVISWKCWTLWSNSFYNYHDYNTMLSRWCWPLSQQY